MEQDKKNWRRDELATRIDLRMPNEVYDRVVEIATAAGEKINPKSGQVRLTATLNKLIEIGIRQLSDENPTELFDSPIINPMDIGLNNRIGKLEDMYRELSDKQLSDSHPVSIGLTPEEIELTVTRAIDKAYRQVSEAIEPLSTRLSELESRISTQPAKEKAKPSPSKPDGGLTIAELTEKLGMSRQAIESRRNAGTLEGLGYRAEQAGGRWYYLPIE